MNLNKTIADLYASDASEKAHKHISDISIGKTEWRMSVPVNKTNDSDCILGKPLKELSAAKEVIREQRRLLERAITQFKRIDWMDCPEVGSFNEQDHKIFAEEAYEIAQQALTELQAALEGKEVDGE